MDRIRVCVVAPEFLPVWGGVGAYLVQLVGHLPEQIEVHVVTTMRERIGKQNVSASGYDFSRYFGGNVHIHFVSRATDSFFYNASFQLACLRYVPELIRKEGIDIVHFGHHMAGLLLELKGLNTPRVTTVHTTIQGQIQGTRMSGMQFKDLAFSEKTVYLTYPFLRLAETTYFSLSRYYITVSKWMKQELHSQYPKTRNSPLQVIYNSVDTELFSPSLKVNPVKRHLILFTGRLIAGKGLKYLTEAIPLVLKEYPDAFFAFVGAGDYTPYRRRLKDLGITEKNFAFLGYLKDAAELIEYYRTCSVYVAPTTLSENLPIRVLEAMACAAPVVASNVCAIPEAIDNGKNGILISPSSIMDLSSAICALLGDANFSRKIGDNARKTILERFDCEASTIKTAQLYRSILDNS